MKQPPELPTATETAAPRAKSRLTRVLTPLLCALTLAVTPSGRAASSESRPSESRPSAAPISASTEASATHSPAAEVPAEIPALIPGPTRYEATSGHWRPAARMTVAAPDTAAFSLRFLAEELFPDCRIDRRIDRRVNTPTDRRADRRSETVNNGGNRDADLLFRTVDTLATEAYTLEITDRQVTVGASSEAGFLYALQTLAQLLHDGNGAAAGCRIYDAPRVKWRALQLDSGRQYHRPETIRKYLDLMLSLKMNVFQWHLTEGLGWRVEILAYPRLAREGSRVADGPEQQGYYTRQEIHDIVRYAAERNIMIVPEIDIPGHAEAALWVYPEFGCTGLRPEIPRTGFTANIFCAGKDATIRFLEQVLDEVCELFPAPYIHLGGDEAPKQNWDRCPDCQRRIARYGLSDSHDLQRWLAHRLANHVARHGKQAILFGDVTERDGYPLADNVVIHWWNYIARQDRPLRAALADRRPVICGTNRYCYLNFPVTPWAGYAENRTFGMRELYERNPSYVTDANPLILGMTASLWTDYNVVESMIDRRLLPRLLALSEQMWRQTPLEPYEAFRRRTGALRPAFEARGYGFGPESRETTPADYRWD